MIFLFPYPAPVKIATTFMSLAFFLISINQIFVGILQKNMSMLWSVLAENIHRLVFLAGVLAVIYFDYGFQSMMAVIVASNIVFTVFYVIFSRRFVHLSLSFNSAEWKKIILRAWPIAVSIIFNLIYLRGDLFTMSLVRTQEEVGLYGAAFRIIDVLNTIPFMVMGVILPLLTSAWSRRDKPQFEKHLQLGFDIMAFLSVPLALGGAVLSTPLIKLLGGSEFAAAGVFLRILLLAVIGVYCGAAFSHGIIAVNAQRRTVWIYGINAVLAVIGYILFIPTWGGYAAAVITAINELLVPTLITIILWRLTRFHINLQTFWKILLSSAIMVFLIWPIRNLPLWFPLIAGAVIYTLFSIMLKVIPVRTLREAAGIRTGHR
jgi:O-antigen/teichoic acid export membrane protein